MTNETTSTPVENTQAPVEAVKESSHPVVKEDKPSDRDDRHRRGGRKNSNRQQAREPKEFEEAILQIDRVTRVVSGGRRLRFRISVVIGDQKGRVGFGIGKSAEVMVGIQKAVAQAKRSLITVPVFNGTIPHEMNCTFKSSRVLLFPAPEGKGVIAGGAVRRILELAGVKDVLSKVHGSRNKLNVSIATMKALQGLAKQEPHRKVKPEGKKVETEKSAHKEEALAEKKTPIKKGVSKETSVKKPTAKK